MCIIIIIIIAIFCCVFRLTFYVCVEHGDLVADIGKDTVLNREYNIIDDVLCSLFLIMPCQ